MIEQGKTWSAGMKKFVRSKIKKWIEKEEETWRKDPEAYPSKLEALRQEEIEIKKREKPRGERKHEGRRKPAVEEKEEEEEEEQEEDHDSALVKAYACFFVLEINPIFFLHTCIYDRAKEGRNGAPISTARKRGVKKGGETHDPVFNRLYVSGNSEIISDVHVTVMGVDLHA